MAVIAVLYLVLSLARCGVDRYGVPLAARSRAGDRVSRRGRGLALRPGLRRDPDACHQVKEKLSGGGTGVTAPMRRLPFPTSIIPVHFGRSTRHWRQAYIRRDAHSRLRSLAQRRDAAPRQARPAGGIRRASRVLRSSAAIKLSTWRWSLLTFRACSSVFNCMQTAYAQFCRDPVRSRTQRIVSSPRALGGKRRKVPGKRSPSPSPLTVSLSLNTLTGKT